MEKKKDRALEVRYISKALDCWCSLHTGWARADHTCLSLSLNQMVLLPLIHQNSWSHQLPLSTAAQRSIFWFLRLEITASDLQCAQKSSSRSDVSMAVHQPSTPGTGVQIPCLVGCVWSSQRMGESTLGISGKMFLGDAGLWLCHFHA